MYDQKKFVLNFGPKSQKEWYSLLGHPVYYLNKMLMTPHIENYISTSTDPKSEMYAESCMHLWAEKTTFLGKVN